MSDPKSTETPAVAPASPSKKPRLSQEDVPGYSLDQALRVPRAIADAYAFKPSRPLNVASAMKMTPTSGGFRGMTGAAIAYGLTSGGYNSAEIGITPLGMRVVRPTREGDDLAAKREALLKPKVVGEFLRQYDGAPLPNPDIAKNVLLDKGVPAERVGDVLTLIVDGAKNVGFLREINGKQFVDLSGAGSGSSSPSEPQVEPPRSSPMGASPASPAVSVGSGVHINIEIHIAADAESQVIEDIFRNMRRYVLSADGATDEE